MRDFGLMQRKRGNWGNFGMEKGNWDGKRGIGRNFGMEKGNWGNFGMETFEIGKKKTLWNWEKKSGNWKKIPLELGKNDISKWDPALNHLPRAGMEKFHKFCAICADQI